MIGRRRKRGVSWRRGRRKSRRSGRRKNSKSRRKSRKRGRMKNRKRGGRKSSNSSVCSSRKRGSRREWRKSFGLFDFLMSLSTTRLYRRRVPRLTSDNFTCCHT